MATICFHRIRSIKSFATGVVQLSVRNKHNIEVPPAVKIPPWFKGPENFDHVVFPPGDRLLPILPKEPVQKTLEESEEDFERRRKIYSETFVEDVTPPATPYQDQWPPLQTNRLIEIRGPELYHNELIHKQYGLAAVTGGMLTFKQLETIRVLVNHMLEKKEVYKDAFAIWRIPAPWLGRPKRAKGVKMGGGKGKVHHWVTPVKSGRIIFELGGRIVEDQGRQIIAQLADKMPFYARFVSYDELLEEKANEERLKEMNKNRYTYEFCMKWNMHNCSKFLSTYDFLWGGKYT